MNSKELKGGSLSSTILCEENGIKWVRKGVKLRENREYGYQRWYSQLKRMQRYSVMFPELFPKIIKYGITQGNAYFDMEYIEGSVTAYQFLSNDKDHNKIHEFIESLLYIMSVMHDEQIKSHPEAMQLYIKEEIEQKLRDSWDNVKFENFYGEEKIIFNGIEIPSLSSKMSEYKEKLMRYGETTETFTHGNLTLENIMYNPETDTITLIDPYEENIIDSRLCDYSQLLQSCDGKYEKYSCGHPIVEGNNKVTWEVPNNYGIDYFNLLFNGWLVKNLSTAQRESVALLEISQFIRMLPFKIAAGRVDHAIFFYSLASKLYNDLHG